MSGTTPVDLLVVGAGPAGLAAASVAAEEGLSCVVVDEQAAPGGQIYRNIETVAAERPGVLATLGADYQRGRDLVTRFRASGAELRPGHRVWDIPAPGRVAVADGAAASLIPARHLLLATGAQERPVPIPGWTLPGVMTVGAVQTLIKSSAIVPEGRVVLAGSGPLLLLLAVQLLDLGVPPAAILMTDGLANRLKALSHLAGCLPSLPAIAKGLLWMRRLKAAGVMLQSAVSEIAAEGEERVERVAWTRGGRRRSLPVDLLLLHQGVTPVYHLAAAAGCPLQWDDGLHCWTPTVDAWGRTAVPGLSLAGDGAGVVGAAAAALGGRLAGLDILCRLGRIDEAARDDRARADRRAWRRERALRPFLNQLFDPPLALRRPDDAVTLCRCEMVRAAEVRDLADLCAGVNQLKAFTRAGMGPCQGRLCANTVSEVLAEARGVGAAAVGVYAVRPPVKPVTLGQVAAMPRGDTEDGTGATLADYL